jgi:hypothetical protein
MAYNSSQGPITVFFSCPGDLATEKGRLKDVVEELAPAFARRGFQLRAWDYENCAVPAATRRGESVQEVVDSEMPRAADLSLGYDIYVGLMCRRIGTPVGGAASGTIHEYEEAKGKFDRDGIPKILFYFCDSLTESDGAEADPQVAMVNKFRAEYPGLFATFRSAEDLEGQFRKHLLGLLLDLCFPPPPQHIARILRSREWVGTIEREIRERNLLLPPSRLDNSPERARRMLRRLEELVNVGSLLTSQEQEVLCACAYLTLLSPDLDETHIRQLMGAATELSPLIVDTLQRLRDPEASAPIIGEGPRCDLIAALLAIGQRLVLDQRSVAKGVGWPPADAEHLAEWIALLTPEIDASRGVVTYHLRAPSSRWAHALKGATAMALEGLWQRLRRIVTKYGVTVSVAPSRVELNPDLATIPGAVLELLKTAANDATEQLPRIPHFGKPIEWRDLGKLTPLPNSRVRMDVVFRAPVEFSRRLKINDRVVAERGEGDTGEIVLKVSQLHPQAVSRCVLEVDKGYGFEPARLAALRAVSAVELAILESARNRDEHVEALLSLELWNEVLELLWPDLLSGTASRERLILAYRVFRDSFDALGQVEDAEVGRLRDLYWDAMEWTRDTLTTQGGSHD